jgi:murein DD-endopeptidase MepM/ murein hydrolase activator NlpD
MPFAATAFAVAITCVAAILPPITIGGRTSGDEPLFPAAPGYLLPWEGGQIHEVTQGEETSFTHNATAAYAFDFDLNYDTVVAARSGRVTMVRDSSNSGGCNASYSGSTNYVVIDHGDGTSGAYLHLAYDSAQVVAGQLVERGQPIAISGETGVTCGADDGGPGPHLHFQVQRTEEGHYFTQSLPVAFDDINRDGGVPDEGESYASGNYGTGQPQKIRLTPYRVPRVYNPVAIATNPKLIEADPNAVHIEPTPEAPSADAETPAADAGALTPDPDDTPTATTTPTKTPTATATPTSTQTPTPIPTETPAPTSSDTPTPEPTIEDTPVASAGEPGPLP